MFFVIPIAIGIIVANAHTTYRVRLHGCSLETAARDFWIRPSRGSLVALIADYPVEFTIFTTKQRIAETTPVGNGTPTSPVSVPATWAEFFKHDAHGATLFLDNGTSLDATNAPHVAYGSICYAESHWEK